ncbi:MAG: hypothetical protein HZB39_03640 [Planctomycetes bacterium]|nr:hypothetical protein [Planctomycetota bacterium]
MSTIAILVGPLAGYFGDGVRAAARENGEAPPDDDALRASVVAWREWISEGLEREGLLLRPLVWDESTPPDPGHALLLPALQALKLFLSHGGSASCPPELPPDPELDPAWVALAESDFADTSYDQLLVPELWLPAAFDFTFACPLPDGHEVQAGSVDALLAQCAALRERLFAATPIDAAMWAEAPPSGAGVRALARHAAGRIERAASSAAASRVPMLLCAAPISRLS